jgi:hypothetical protein
VPAINHHRLAQFPAPPHPQRAHALPLRDPQQQNNDRQQQEHRRELICQRSRLADFHPMRVIRGIDAQVHE